ncbi:MAG TPA: radical SAM protein [Vicinamibacterales bacterium]|nr:radical SAM protein [Vicinamibacterales bacterium]
MSDVDVLLGQSYFLRFDPKLSDAQQPYAPLGTLYAAAWLRERGYRVALFDAMLADSEDEWADALDRGRPRVAVLFEDSFNYLSKLCLLRMREAAFAMIRMARDRDCPIVVCGPDATDHPALYLQAGAAAVIAGEGEVTLQAVVDVWLAGGAARLKDVAGLWLPGPDGGARPTPARDRLRDLDALPPPAWDLVDVERYRALWRTRHGYFAMNAVTTRGCPYHCNWCARPVYGQRYAVTSPARVAAHVAALRDTYRPDCLTFVDDIFGLTPGWVEAYADRMVETGSVVPFKCLLRADLVGDRIVSALVRAGCESVWMGAESGSQKILDAMDKGTRVDQIERGTRLLQDAGIAVGWFLQFGYAGETWEDIQLTRAMLRRTAPDDIGVSISYPLPGTNFYEKVRAQLGEQRNWRDSDDLAMMYHGAYSTAFYRALHRLVHTEFRMRRAARGVRAALRHPATIRLRRHGRIALSAARHALALPVARARVARLARDPGGVATPIAMPHQLAAAPRRQEP